MTHEAFRLTPRSGWGLTALFVMAACGAEPTVHGALTGNTTIDLGPAIEVPLLITCGETVVRDASDLLGDFAVTVEVPESAATDGTVECTVTASLLAFRSTATVSLAVSPTAAIAPVTEIGVISLDPPR